MIAAALTRLRVALGAILVVALSGCDHSGHAHESVAQEHGATTATRESPDLELNDGNKWQADPHTRAVVAKLRAELEAPTPSSLEGMGDLGSALDGLLKELIAGCTMTGPAHDQLHRFLLTFMPKVEHLSKATDLAQAKAIHLELRDALAEYDRFFA